MHNFLNSSSYSWLLTLSKSHYLIVDHSFNFNYTHLKNPDTWIVYIKKLDIILYLPCTTHRTCKLVWLHWRGHMVPRSNSPRVRGVIMFLKNWCVRENITNFVLPICVNHSSYIIGPQIGLGFLGALRETTSLHTLCL